MNFSFSEEQEAIQELAGQIIGDLATPERLLEFDKQSDAIDRDLWKQLAEANLLGIYIDEEYGGAGLGLLELTLLLEAQGRFVAPVPLLPTLVFGAGPIAEFGTEAQRKDILPRVIAGESILTAALYEVGHGDAARPGTAATQEGGDWILEGEKSCVPYAQLASHILVPAQTGDGTIGVFILDPSTAGVELEALATTSHEPQSILRLSGVRIPAAGVLGDPHEGQAVIDWVVERALLALSANQLGVAAAALQQTAEYTSTRKQFGRPIGSFQGVSMRAADSYIDLQAMRSTLWQAAWRLSEGLDARREVLAAQWWACMGGHRVVHTAMHLHGGTGADVEYPIHRYFLWAKQNEQTLGAAGRQLARLGDLLSSEGIANA